MEPDSIAQYLEHKGYDDEEIDDFLEHFGIKGMKWGVRKDRAPGASAKTDREAKKDAQEYARAAMFYGKGAGTRRKLIRATVDAKSKRDPSYAKAFEFHSARQDMSQHSAKARSERTKVDRKERNKARAGYLARRFTGEMGTQAAFAAVALGAAAYAQSPKFRAAVKTNIKVAETFVKSKANVYKINKVINKGFGNG